MTAGRVVQKPDSTNNPREYYEIVVGATTYRIASGTQSMLVDGLVYVATPMARSTIPVVDASAESALELTLPVDHALARRYLQAGVPPQQIIVTVRRKDGSTTKRIWVGEVTSMSVDDEGTEATFYCPSRAGSALERFLPTVTAGRKCPHMLYGDVCGVSRTDSGPSGLLHKVTTTVSLVNGRTVRVDLSTITATDPLRSKWAVMGELVHVASGERMTIVEQHDVGPGSSTVTNLDLQMPIPGMKIGDSIEVYAGCDWTILTCDEKFDNLPSHGGYTYLPVRNPFIPGRRIEEGS